MKTTVERLEPTKVKLTVEVEPERVSKAFDAAAREMARSVTIPGFRRGKVPRRVLEARLGKAALLQNAMEDSIGRFYAEAVQAEQVDAVAPPQIDLQHFSEEEGCAFEATVEVRPEVELPDHTGISVSFPDWEVSEEDVRTYVDDLRERFAELEEVDRPARTGDYVTIDLAVTREGQPIEQARAEDALYHIGSGGVTPKLDEELVGAAPGQTLVYVDTLPDDYPEHGGKPAEFTVTIKDVREKRLPELDDDFATSASEFDTLAELEDDMRRNLQTRKLANARQELRGRVLEAYLATVDVPLPESMVQAEKQGRLDQLRRQAEQYGLDMEQLLGLQDTTLEQATQTIEEQAETAVKAQLVLEALAQQLGVGVASADLEQEIYRLAAQRGQEPEEIARQVSDSNAVGVLVGDVVRRKALDALVAAAEIEGAPSEDVMAALGMVPAPAREEAALAGEEPVPGTGEAGPAAAAEATDEVVEGAAAAHDHEVADGPVPEDAGRM